MKAFITLILACSFFGITQAQVGIGTISPNAQLDITSSNQGTPSNTDGLLIPKIDEYPATIPTVAQDGMLVYVTGNGTPTKGFYYWDQATTAWIPFQSSSEWTDMGGYLSPSDGFSEDISIGGADNATARLTVRSDKAIAGLFTNTSVQNGWDIGVNTYLNNNSTSVSSFTVGNYNDVINEGQGNLFGEYNRVRGDGSAVNTGVHNNLYGASSGAQYGSYQIISNTGNGEHYGTRNVLSGNGSGNHYSMFSQISGAGDGIQTGVNTNISNSGDGAHYGIQNNLNGTGTGSRVGMRNDLNGAANGSRNGVLNFMGGSGNGQRTGVTTFLSATGNGFQMGSQTNISNSGDGSHYGSFNSLSGGGIGGHYGIYNYLTGSGTGNQYGVLNDITNNTDATIFGTGNSISSSGNGEHTAVSNSIFNGGTGINTGLENFINTSGSGLSTGTSNIIVSSGTGESVATNNRISGSGNGTKYGSQTTIDAVAGGLHYGVYSNVLKPGSFAGYFLGNVAIGTGGANMYTLPATRGTIGQVMQTDGSGNVSWASQSFTNTSPAWHIGGSSNDATTVNDDMFRYGKVAIGTNVNSYPLQILSADERYTFLSFANNTEINAPKDNAHFEIISNANNNFINGISNVVSGSGTLQYLTGQYNDVINNTNGFSVGNTNFVQANGNGPAEGIFNSLAVSGTGNSNAIRNEITGTGSGIHTGISTTLSSTGAGGKYGSQILIQPGAGGQHYGLYAEVLKSGAFAGYFLGNVSVGTTVSNNYVLPASRGTNGQIMQTDASGNLSWATPSSLGFDELSDADGDTKVQVEEGANDNVIRFDNAGFESMVITAAGNVGINQANPNGTFHVRGDIYIEDVGSTDNWHLNTDNSDDFNFYYNGALRSYIRDTDGMYVVFSDKRLKRNVKPMSKTISEKIMALNPVNYSYNSDDSDTLQHGFIAQEVQALFPELVDTKYTEGGEFLSLNYQAFGVLAIQKIQEQQGELQALKERVSELEMLKQRILKLEKK